MSRGLKWFQGFGLLCTLAQHAVTYRACGRPYTRPNVAAVSGQPALTLIVAHGPLLLCKAGGEDTRFATFMASQMETLTRFGGVLSLTAPPLILLQPEGQPRDCSSDRRRIVDLAQVLAVAQLDVWALWENSVVVLGGEGGGSEVEARADFGRWPPRLLTMARRLADLWMHTSGPEKLKEPDENTQSAQPSNSPLRPKPVFIRTSRRRAVQLNTSLSRGSGT